jgi:hypothetical protein
VDILAAHCHSIDLDTETELSVEVLQDVPAGSLLRIAIASFGIGASIEVLRALAGTELPVVFRQSAADFGERFVWYAKTGSLAVVRTSEDMRAGSLVVLTVRPARPFDETQPVKVGTVMHLQLRLVADLDAEIAEPVTDLLAVQIVPGEATRLEAYLKPDGRVLVTHFDRSGAPAGCGVRPTKVVADGLEAAAEPLTAASSLSRVKHGSDQARVTARSEAGLEARSNAWPRAMDGTPMYFGEFHWHTELSCDGSRSLPDALRSARDELGLDFAGSSEHMWANGQFGEGKGVPEQAALCRSFDDPGKFAVLPGFELSCRYGHANVYTDDFALLAELADGLRGEYAKEQKNDLRYPWGSLLALCPAGRSLLVPHHTNMDSYVTERVVREDGRAWWGPMDWPVEVDRTRIRLIEMVQNRGAFESEVPDPAWKTLFGGYGGSARTALARGYRIGFTGGSDNHCGWPTRKRDGYGGLTVVQCASLDTRSVFKALHDRRCYATSGARIVADATLNGHPMGSELRLPGGAKREFKVHVQGTAPLDRVEVVSWDVVAGRLSLEPGATDLEATWVDDRPGRPMSGVYYYVRVRQQDGHCAWLSPWWVDAE